MKTLGQVLSWELLASIFSDNNSDNFIRNANKLLTLKNSREFETKADLGGLELLEKNHIDMRGMIEMFEIMVKLPQSKSKQPVYLSTHPDTEDRLETVKNEVRGKKNDFAYNENLDSLFREMTATY